ncbi:hypothetical protein ACOMHN_002191 [Nucella lapillus]
MPRNSVSCRDHLIMTGSSSGSPGGRLRAQASANVLRESTACRRVQEGEGRGRRGRPSCRLPQRHKFKLVRAQCDGEMVTLKADSVQRTFDSPNYPNDYPSNSYCQWLLAAPNEDYTVRLDTLAMDLEPTQGCVYDSITVYNGQSKKSSQLRRYCVGYFSIYSTGHHLLVVFKSDENYDAGGFRLRYVALLKDPPTRTTPLTTTTKPEEKGNRNWVNTGALIGGVVGGVCFVIILGIVCGRCVGRGELRQPPTHHAAAFYHSHAPPISPPGEPGGEGSTISTAVHMMQNNNTVFMVSQAMGTNLSPTRFTSHFTSGVTNMGFDRSGEHSTMGMSTMMDITGGAPPPCYTDAMLETHPPALPPTPTHQNPGTSGLAPPPLRASRGSGDAEQPGPSGETTSLPVPSVRIEISPPETEVPQILEASPPPEIEPLQQSEMLPSEEESEQQSDSGCPETEAMQQSEAPQQSESCPGSGAQQRQPQSPSSGAEAPLAQPSSEEEATQQAHVSPSGADAQTDSSSHVEVPQQSEMSLSETNSLQQAAISPSVEQELQQSENCPHGAKAPQQSEISPIAQSDSLDSKMSPREMEASQKSDISATGEDAGQQVSQPEAKLPQHFEASPCKTETEQRSEVCSSRTGSLQTETEIPKPQFSNLEQEASPQPISTNNSQASALPSVTVNPTTSSVDPEFTAAMLYQAQNELDSGTVTPPHHTVSETESPKQEVIVASTHNYVDQEDTVEGHPIITESDYRSETEDGSGPQNEEEFGEKDEHQTSDDSGVDRSTQEESASAEEMTHNGGSGDIVSEVPSVSLPVTDGAKKVDNEDMTVAQPDVCKDSKTLLTTISTTQNETREGIELNLEKAGSYSLAENPTCSAEHKDQSTSQTEKPQCAEPQPQPTVLLTEHPDTVTDTASRTLIKPSEDIPAEPASLAADISDFNCLEAAGAASGMCHRSTELTSSTTSLPPPPSPHAVSDSDSEDFPPAPSPLAVDTLGSPGLPRVESPSFLLEPPPGDECPHTVQAGYLGDGSQEELCGAASFESFSSHFSPLLNERQLRNSTSFPDIARQVEVIKRETLQRADSQ